MLAADADRSFIMSLDPGGGEKLLDLSGIIRFRNNEGKRTGIGAQGVNDGKNVFFWKKRSLKELPWGPQLLFF
jgi:hypothetical protein